MSRFSSVPTRLCRLFEALGFPGAINHLAQRLLSRRLRFRQTYKLKSKSSRYPLLCRAGSSDHDVFYQIFILQEYQILDKIPLLADKSSVKLIIDCGANVGYSSSYFLSRFPCCRLIAVEPDKANFAIMQLNLAPFGDRIRLVNSAVWSHPTQLRMSLCREGDGRDWTRQVEECDLKEPDCFGATDIPTLLGESGENRISILKMDIEGAESVIFGSERLDWIDLVDVIVIELHKRSKFGDPTELFRRACDGRFEFMQSGELTIAVRWCANRSLESIHRHVQIYS